MQRINWKRRVVKRCCRHQTWRLPQTQRHPQGLLSRQNGRLREAGGTIAPVRAREPHFTVFPEFEKASYAKRYEVLLTKLVRERLYDAACFLMSSAADGARGAYREPAAELSFENFIASLLAKAIAVTSTKE